MPPVTFKWDNIFTPLNNSQTHTNMKKLVTFAVSLLLFAGSSFAAGTKVAKQSQAVNKAVPASGLSSSSLISARSLSEIIEENAALRLQVEELTSKTENLANMFDYSKMMHVTMNNLHEEVLKKQREDTSAQLDYAKMMNATIVHLSNLIAGNQLM
jgi:hypothetical protein